MTNVLTNIRLNNLQYEIETANFPQGLVPVPYNTTLNAGGYNMTNGLYTSANNSYLDQVDTETGIYLNINSDLDFKTTETGGTATSQKLKNVGIANFGTNLALQTYVDYTSDFMMLQVKDLKNDQGWGTIYDTYYNKPPSDIEPSSIVNFSIPNFPSTPINLALPANSDWILSGNTYTTYLFYFSPTGTTQTFNSVSLQMDFFGIAFADTFPNNCFLYLSPASPTQGPAPYNPINNPNGLLSRHGIEIPNGPSSIPNTPINFTNLILTSEVSDSLAANRWYVVLSCNVPTSTPGAFHDISFGMTGVTATASNFQQISTGITIEKV